MERPPGGTQEGSIASPPVPAAALARCATSGGRTNCGFLRALHRGGSSDAARPGPGWRQPAIAVLFAEGRLSAAGVLRAPVLRGADMRPHCPCRPLRLRRRVAVTHHAQWSFVLVHSQHPAFRRQGSDDRVVVRRGGLCSGAARAVPATWFLTVGLGQFVLSATRAV